MIKLVILSFSSVVLRLFNVKKKPASKKLYFSKSCKKRFLYFGVVFGKFFSVLNFSYGDMVVLLPEKLGFGPKMYSICSQLYYDKCN